MPDGAQPLFRKWYYVFHPGLSWQQWRRGEETTSEFVDQFFDDGDEYERYVTEFFQGRITDVCEHALDDVDGDRRVFDTHQDECAKLYALIRKRRPEVVVETGVYSGVSTTSILLALSRNRTGTLYSIDAGRQLLEEHDGSDHAERRAAFYERSRPSCAEAGSHVIPGGRRPGWIVPSDLEDRWELTIGRSRRVLPTLLADVGDVSLFYHDSEHSMARMLFEFELAWEWLESGGVLLSHHIEHNDAFETFVSERGCTHGRASFEYGSKYATVDYDESCSMGYAIKE